MVVFFFMVDSWKEKSKTNATTTDVILQPVVGLLPPLKGKMSGNQWDWGLVPWITPECLRWHAGFSLKKRPCLLRNALICAKQQPYFSCRHGYTHPGDKGWACYRRCSLALQLHPTFKHCTTRGWVDKWIVLAGKLDVRELCNCCDYFTNYLPLLLVKFVLISWPCHPKPGQISSHQREGQETKVMI